MSYDGIWQLGKERAYASRGWKTQLTFQRSRREAIEAAIHDLESELKLPTPNRRPNPVCARNEITRLALDVLREAGGRG